MWPYPALFKCFYSSLVSISDVIQPILKTNLLEYFMKYFAESMTHCVYSSSTGYKITLPSVISEN